MSLKYILLLPILEILLFILFGDFFGFFPVIFYILITGLLGLFLLKSGINPENMKDIVANPKDWVYKKIAGVLLFIPGFTTDLMGIMLLIRSLRGFVWDFVPDKTKNYFYSNSKGSRKEDIIEVDYKDLDEN